MTLCSLLRFSLLSGKLALKKQSSLSLYSMAEVLKAVLALCRQELQDNRARLGAGPGPLAEPRGTQWGDRPLPSPATFGQTAALTSRYSTTDTPAQLGRDRPAHLLELDPRTSQVVTSPPAG